MTTARAAGLPFVPELEGTADNFTLVDHAGRLWDLCRWMPGKADFHDQPTIPRIEAACTALALLHRAWAGLSAPAGPCPAVLRRLHAHREWLDWTAGIDVLPSGPEDLRPLAQEAWQVLKSRMPHLPASLVFWTNRSFPLQPCLCDVWHDHVLFDGDRVSGIIDYGGAKIDHVAVDLARLLGSMAVNSAQLRNAGLDAYRRLRALSYDEEQLITILDETGRLIGLATWLKWLYRDSGRFEDISRVELRMRELLRATSSA
jgi:homoserine kinase type II